MKNIKVLDKAITNRISAGEVVEKPASIIKELLENSIDAKADRIVVEIVGGGIEKIAVTDNGVGILKEDMTLSIASHATSKISAISDLDGISTLGFRGEALASIASVSILEIISKPENQELGEKLVAKGGEIFLQTEIAAPKGTHIEMTSLFYNTPVRAKFLRRPKTEEADITDYMERIMLAFPHIAFKYIIDGKIKYNTSGGSLIENIYTIYGQETAESLIEINHKHENFSIKGYIGKPEISKPNRNYQTLFVSGRYVKNYMVSSAIQTAYDSFLMKHKFPFYVLDLILPYDSVDVNVHPNKLEVKFENSNAIFGAFHKVALNALATTNQTRQIELEEKTNDQLTSQAVENLQQIMGNEGASYSAERQEQVKQGNLFDGLLTNLSEQKLQSDMIDFNKSTIVNRMAHSPKEVVISSQTVSAEQTENKQENQNENQVPNQETSQSVYEVVDYKIVGTLFKTYNIIESGEVVYFIDQHAAHERILYDKYMTELANQNIAQQQLLVPYILQVKDVEKVFLNSYKQALQDAGFDIEEFGFNAFKVAAIPYIFSTLKLENFFEDLLKDYKDYEKAPLDYLKNVIATKACKAAVKAGHSLTDLEIKTIFTVMKNGVLQCPHGRPFVLKLDKVQVEKWFKRVL